MNRPIRYALRAGFLCLSMLLPAIAPAAARQYVLNVSGTVTASDGTPISGATVSLRSQGTALEATSDAHGRFQLDGVHDGTYQISASAPGYTPLSERTTVLNTAGDALTLVLLRATTSSLTVIGSVRAGAGETISTSSAPTVFMSAQGSAAQGVTRVSDMVWDQLSATPVLPLGGGSNATVSYALRGPDPTETLVDVDGHQVNNGNTGDFDLSLVDPAALQAVQLVYGISPSSLVGPNTIGGAINVLTLEPTTTPQTLIRGFGGSFGTFGETVQTTGTRGPIGYAVSLHQAISSGSVNQPVLDSNSGTNQEVGSAFSGQSILTKLRYQLGGQNGYGFLQLDFRDQAVAKDESALLTTFTPGTGYQSAAGTSLSGFQTNYGFDAQLPIGSEPAGTPPATMLSFSHLTTLNSQSVDGPLADSLPYLYNDRDLLNDDWLQIDRRFTTGDLSFKYDLGTESLATDYVQGQVTAQSVARRPEDDGGGDQGGGTSPATQVFPLAQTERSAVLRYNGDPTSHIHYSLATYFSNYSSFGTSTDPRAGFVWTPTGDTAIRASAGTTFQTPQLSELIVPPASSQVPIGGVVYVGNPNLKPDHATEYDLGADQLFGPRGRQLHLSLDLYQTNLRTPSSQLNVNPVSGCGSPALPCPVSYPINAGDGMYRGVQIKADQQIGERLHVRLGWDEDSSFLTAISPEVQDGTLDTDVQTLGQPLHKAFIGFDRTVDSGLGFGAELDYQGMYNELNRPPFATLQAHATWNTTNDFQIGLYGTNLTNVYADPFTNATGGILYDGGPGNPAIQTPGYVLEGRKILLVLTRSL